jgi:hypothetical protein
MTPPTCRENLAQLVPNWNPELGCTIAVLSILPNCQRLEDYDQQRKTHRELREQVVKCGGEGELKTVNGESFHLSTSNLPGTKLDSDSFHLPGRGELIQELV